jgi:arylsulfatase A-like enzyme
MVYNMDIFPTLLDALGMQPPACDGRSFLPALTTPQFCGRDDVYLEFHGIRFLFSQRALITRDGWKYIFTPGDTDEVYDLNTDPAELRNLVAEPDCAERIANLRYAMMARAEAACDPLAPCICKYFGHWETARGQIETSSIHAR